MYEIIQPDIYYVVPRNGRWSIIYRSHRYGDYRRRISALEAAVADARTAALMNPGGANVRVTDGHGGWTTCWTSDAEHARALGLSGVKDPSLHSG